MRQKAITPQNPIRVVGALVFVCGLTITACNKSDAGGDNSKATQSKLEAVLQPEVVESASTSSTSEADAAAPVSAVATGSSGIVDSQALSLGLVANVDTNETSAANDQSQALDAARFATAGTIDAYPQRPGDVQAGRKALIEEAYVSCGLPERVFRQLLPPTPPDEIDGRHARADGLPFSVNVFTNDDGVSVVSNNCLTCHGTVLFGELVVGLGNEFLDFTTDTSAAVERAGALVQGEAETRAWELFADRINAISAYTRPHTVGANPANNLTFALIAHRDAQTNAWSNEPLLPLPPTDVPPVSVPPWWRMAKKPAMFNLGEGRRDHARIMMAASMLCTDSLEELDEIDAYAPDIRAYIASLKAPKYPFDIDLEQAVQGEQVFNDNCSHCHGTYGADTSYPARLVPLEIVGTDSTLVDFAYNDGVQYIDWFNKSYYGKLSTAAPGPGYVAPPLDGIWATAPFLHNGSVPTIAMVIDSTKRPAFWQHDVIDASNPQSYDQQNLGWAHQVLPAGKSGPNDVRIFDTTQPGYANSGHRFGDHLTDEQRPLLIEYLKTL